MGHWKEIGVNGFSPAFVATAGAISLVAVSGTFWFTGSGAAASRSSPSVGVGHFVSVLAYLIGLFSCLRAAFSYPKASPMRLGWLALGGNCLLSVCRHIELNPAFQPKVRSVQAIDLWSQAFQLPALLSALLGILAIWWGLYRLGLGFRLRWYDLAGVFLAASLLAWAFRNHLSHAQADQPVLMILQRTSLTLLLSIGGVSLLLHSLAQQMGGGKLAVVMRCVAAYALTRSMLNVLQENRDSYLFLWWFCFFSVPWVFAFGAAYFCWIADTVRRDLSEFGTFKWSVSGMRGDSSEQV